MFYLHHIIFIYDQVDFERLALVSVWCSPVDDVLCSLPFHTLMLCFYCCLTLFTVNNSQNKKAMISLLRNIKLTFMFSPWPGLAPPVIVPGYVLRIRAWASEHKNAKKKHQDSWQPAGAATAHDKHLDHHNFLITTALIIDQPSKCARSLVALRLLSAAALGTPGHGQSGFSKT